MPLSFVGSYFLHPPEARAIFFIIVYHIITRALWFAGANRIGARNGKNKQFYIYQYPFTRKQPGLWIGCQVTTKMYHRRGQYRSSSFWIFKEFPAYNDLLSFIKSSIAQIKNFFFNISAILHYQYIQIIICFYFHRTEHFLQLLQFISLKTQFVWLTIFAIFEWFPICQDNDVIRRSIAWLKILNFNTFLDHI